MPIGTPEQCVSRSVGFATEGTPAVRYDLIDQRVCLWRANAVARGPPSDGCGEVHMLVTATLLFVMFTLWTVFSWLRVFFAPAARTRSCRDQALEMTKFVVAF